MMMTPTYWLIKVQNPETLAEGFVKLGISDIYTDASAETGTRFETLEDAEEIAGIFEPLAHLPSWNPVIVEISG